MDRIEKAARKYFAEEIYDMVDEDSIIRPIVRFTEKREKRADKEGYERGIRDCAEICDAAKTFYRFMQSKSNPGEKDGMIRAIAAEDIETQILKLSHPKAKKGRMK
jgi:hypothetical protein